MYNLPQPLRWIVGYYLSSTTIVALKDTSFSQEKFWSSRASFRGVSSDAHLVASHISYRSLARAQAQHWPMVLRHIPDILAYEEGMVLDQYDNAFLLCPDGTYERLPHSIHHLCKSFFVPNSCNAVYYLDEEHNLRLSYCNKERKVHTCLRADVQQMVLREWQRCAIVLEKGEGWIYQLPTMLVALEDFQSLLNGDKRKIDHARPIVQVALQVDRCARTMYYWYLDVKGLCYCISETEVIATFDDVHSMSMFGVHGLLLQTDENYLIAEINQGDLQISRVMADEQYTIFFLKGRPFVVYQQMVMSFYSFHLLDRYDSPWVTFAK